MLRLSDWPLLNRAFRVWGIAITLVLLALPVLSVTAGAAVPGTPRFQRTWERSDKPVAELLVSRTWTWGPKANTELLTEPYTEAPGGQRTVQYYDKTRMEDNTYRASEAPWDVTNGLLVVELITGMLQLGDNDFEEREPADVPVAGDLNDPNGVTYAAFGTLLDEAPAAIDSLYLTRVDRFGNLSNDPSLATQGIRAAHIDEVTNHAIAAPFWAFMNSTGLVYENGAFSEDSLFPDPVFGTGRPISEAYWAEVLVGGTPLDVLIQCFERRCLTYNPANPDGWKVEAGNVGLHYYEWRYGEPEEPGQDPPGNPPPGEQPPADPPPGEDPPQDPPPGEEPPQEPPPGEQPPGDPAAELPAAPSIRSADSSLNSDNEAYIEVFFDFESSSGIAEGFRAYRSHGGGFQFLVDIEESGHRFFTDETVEYGEEYCYYLTAYGSDGESHRSNTVCLYAALPAPDLVSPEDLYRTTDRTVEFVWQSSPGAAGYMLCLFLHSFSCKFSPDDTYQYGPLSADTTSYTVTIPEALAPEGVETEIEWTVAACDSHGHCYFPLHERRLTVDLQDQLAAPLLVAPVEGYTVYEREIVVEWQLVQGAATYRVCVFWPGDSCVDDPNEVLISSPLGPTVDSWPMDIPLWFLPGNTARLNWTVAACDADNNCVWQENYRSFYVELNEGAPEQMAPEAMEIQNTSSYIKVVAWNVAEGWTQTLSGYDEPNNGTNQREYHIGGAVYLVNLDGTTTLQVGPEDSHSYLLLVEGDGTSWIMHVDRRNIGRYRFVRYNTAGNADVTESQLPTAALANIPAEFR